MSAFDTSVRTLACLPSWLGDLVMSTPVLIALGEHFAAAGRPDNLVLAGSAHHLTLLDGMLPGAVRLAREPTTAGDVAAWRGHGCALLLAGSFRVAWTAFAARIPERIGWVRDARGALLTAGLRPARERGRTPLGLGRAGRWPRYLPRPFGLECIELVQSRGLGVPDPRPRLVPTARALEAVRGRLDELGVRRADRFLVANVGARADSAKAWPCDKWVEVLRQIDARSGLPVVLVAGPGEEPLLRRVAERVPGARAWPDPMPTLGELVALGRLAAFGVSADNGGRHVLAAAGAPTACVAGPSDPRHFVGILTNELVVRSEVPCGPCHREHCPLPEAENHACMRNVRPEALANAALELPA